MSDQKYDFDPTMSNAANRVLGEQHVITSTNFRDYHYVIPHFAPIYAESLTLAMRNTNGSIRPLIEGKDYYLGFHFIDASTTTDHPIYGAISFLDTDLSGVLTIDYHTVGGIWTLTPQRILEIMANNLRNPRITTWEQVVNPPERFPPINHPHDIVDFKTMTDVQLAVDRVRDAILASSGGGLAAHVGNFANPHNTTKYHVGLGNVVNYGIATVLQAQQGLAEDAYMTPLRVKEAINVFGVELVNAHAIRTDNPHNTTKDQVGLGAVQNYAIATEPEAVAGVVDSKYMTPLRTRNAITPVINDLKAHVENRDNPHGTTKDHIGLFNVQNYAVATAQEARDGALNDRYMTPLRTTQLVAEYVFTAMKTHSDLRNNPHGVDKTQVGLGDVQNFPIASVNEAQTGTRNDRYMTPFLVKQAVGAISGELGDHALNLNNPHQVNKDQIGLANVQNYAIATAQMVLDGVANNYYVTPAGLSLMRAKFTTDLNAHKQDLNNPHGTTAAQVGAYTTSQIDVRLTGYAKTTDTMPNSVLWNGRNELQYGEWLNNAGIEFNATTINGKTADEITQDVLENVGNAFAPQYTPDLIGDKNDPDQEDKLYWVKIHDVFYGNMSVEDSRDGLAMITGGATRKTGNWAIGNNAVMLRTSARATAVGGPLVEVVELTPTTTAEPLRFGYTIDTVSRTLTSWACLSTVSSDLLVTEFGATQALNKDTPTTSETEPTNIVYVTPSSAFTVSAQATQAAGQATTIANGAVTTANAAKSTADSAATTAGQANTAAGTAVSTANSANTTAGQANTKSDQAVSASGQAVTAANAATQNVTALTARIEALENRINGITVS